MSNWKPVVGHEGAYEVSDKGQVRSLNRMVPNGNGMRPAVGRVLSIQTSDRYAKVRLKLNGEGSTKYVHRLVAEAFMGPCPDGLEVCHSNSNPLDNRIENLRYDTHLANCLDRTLAGNSGRPAQERCQHGHELTPENIRKSRRANGGILRVCRTCALARDKRYREQRAAA